MLSIIAITGVLTTGYVLLSRLNRHHASAPYVPVARIRRHVLRAENLIRAARETRERATIRYGKRSACKLG